MKKGLTNGEIWSIFVIFFVLSLISGDGLGGTVYCIILFGSLLYKNRKEKNKNKIEKDYYFALRGYDEQGQPYHSKYGMCEWRWQEIQEKISKGEPWK